MHAWLKRAVAGLLSAGTLLGGGLLTAGTANADEIRMPDIGRHDVSKGARQRRIRLPARGRMEDR